MQHVRAVLQIAACIHSGAPRHVEIRIQGLLVVKRAGARGLGRRLCRTGAPSRARSSSKGKTP